MPKPVVPDPDRWTTMEAGLHSWRRAHPEATWVEVGTEVDRHLDALRADLPGEVATDLPNAAARCPDCGGPLVSRGAHPRTVVTQRRPVTGSEPTAHAMRPLVAASILATLLRGLRRALSRSGAKTGMEEHREGITPSRFHVPRPRRATVRTAAR